MSDAQDIVKTICQVHVREDSPGADGCGKPLTQCKSFASVRRVIHNADGLGVFPRQLRESLWRAVRTPIADEQDLPCARRATEECLDLLPCPFDQWSGVIGRENQAGRRCELPRIASIHPPVPLESPSRGLPPMLYRKP